MWRPGSQQAKDIEMIFFAGAVTCFECFEDAGTHHNEDVCTARLKQLHNEIFGRLEAINEHAKFRTQNIGEQPKRN